MNLLYQSLFPASLLPWAIICLFYLVHGYIFLFVIIAIHLCTHIAVISHRPHEDFSMIDLNRLLHLQRLALWLTYAFRSQWNQHFISLLIFLSIGANIKVLKRYGSLITSTVIHSLFVITFCSSAGIFQLLIAAVCLGIFYIIKKPKKNQWEHGWPTILGEYFHTWMAYNYTMAMAEWSVSDMNLFSLPLIIFACFIFNGCVFINIPKEKDSSKDEWYTPPIIPDDYPYPLNIKDAKERCNIARKLFKSHEL